MTVLQCTGGAVFSQYNTVVNHALFSFCPFMWRFHLHLCLECYKKDLGVSGRDSSDDKEDCGGRQNWRHHRQGMCLKCQTYFAAFLAFTTCFCACEVKGPALFTWFTLHTMLLSWQHLLRNVPHFLPVVVRLSVCNTCVFADFSRRLPEGAREVCSREESKKIRYN